MEELKFDIDLQSILRVLMKYWSVLLTCAVLGGLTGWSLSKWVFSPVYESSITIFAWDSNNENNVSTTTTKAQELDLSTRLVNDYKEIITSRKVSKAVAAQVQAKFPVGNNGYTIASDLQRNTRILKIAAAAATPELAQFAATTTAEVFTKVVKEIMNLKNIQIVDVAELPTSKVKPKPGTNTVIGFFIGLFLAFSACMLRELLDATIKIPEEIPDRLGKNVIGTIPEAKNDDKLHKNGNGSKQTGKIKSTRFFETETGNYAIAEAFKILRTNIEFMMPGKNKSKTVMFTSALPGEGKSTIIANLASSMCESGKKTIILDCDLRKPFMHKFFSLDNSKGLVSIIVGAVPYQDAIHRNALNKGVDLISSGPIPPNPTELLMSEEFKQLLKELSQSYDYIFIDAPPTLNMADTAIIGHLADATMFIITAGKTRMEVIKRCLRQLSQTNIEVSGILLNRFNIEAIKYNYYYNYHYHYNYTSNEPDSTSS
jgi:capsular exopolysaccharide synthesis family protein